MPRIAFFGSDAFSLASLRALRALAARAPAVVPALALVTRRLKPSGRGQRDVTEPPIVAYARAHGIPWTQVETADDFAALPAAVPADLAVAVSYGTLVPAAYLAGLRFGGLNVHPSLLPQYRGAAPLQRAIMDRVPSTGVSVQTLHPTKFDRGTVLWQSPEWPLAADTTLPELREALGELGAGGLVEVLETGAFKSPERHAILGARPPSWAPRIETAEHRLDFAEPAAAAAARGRGIGRLFFFLEQRARRKQRRVRVILSDFAQVAGPPAPVGTIAELPLLDARPGVALGLRLADGWLGAGTVNVEGYRPEPAAEYFASRGKRHLDEVAVL